MWIALPFYPTQESNQGLPHCRQILYQLSHKGSWRILECIAYPFSRRNWPRTWTRVSWIAREDNSTLLQYSCLENPMDGGAWQAAVHGVAKSHTPLSNFTFTFHFHALEKEITTHSSVLAWRIPGMREPGGLLSMGLHRVGHDWSDLAAAAAAPELLLDSLTKELSGKLFQKRFVYSKLWFFQ